MQLALDIILIILLTFDIIRIVRARRTVQCEVNAPVEVAYSEWVEVNEFFSEGEGTFKRTLRRTDVFSLLEHGEKGKNCTIITQDGDYITVSESYETMKAML